ncbi:undecaprenyl-diphosphatase UppP [Asticcacaulis biprosthecium C19]|uniref:Undecaprenyl-diphosphatase n=1 Tax=Asticcacaulis biprosthecium C19 TaxID=715226 RepID=F4QL13_9CAUL|nr:undecaprenyl-diphosphate phosphatase [Asticcacaulis biprosthecium]EGF92236.1 undecaprenyl-diphosphatase UppP [Asticcacaulis biprosthecium C19]
MDYLIAVLLGVVEGLTEFLPVSSTGHLLLLTHFLKFETTGKTFEVLIQLGAVLALLTLYFQRLWGVVVTLPTEPRSRGFVISVLVAFLPAMVLGVLLHDFIKTVLFESPQLICISLIVGGVLLWAVDKWAPKPVHDDAMVLDWKTSLIIGLFQCLAMIPGMSRSGSTLIGAMLCKVDKKAAAEFSFFLAMPTMAGAFAYDVFKTYKQMDFSDMWLIVVGFTAAFVTAVLVVKALLAYVSRHGYGVFAVWRICVGVVGLVLLQMGF